MWGENSRDNAISCTAKHQSYALPGALVEPKVIWIVLATLTSQPIDPIQKYYILFCSYALHPRPYTYLTYSSLISRSSHEGQCISGHSSLRLTPLILMIVMHCHNAKLHSTPVFGVSEAGPHPNYSRAAKLSPPTFFLNLIFCQPPLFFKLTFIFLPWGNNFSGECSPFFTPQKPAEPRHAGDLTPKKTLQ